MSFGLTSVDLKCADEHNTDLWLPLCHPAEHLPESNHRLLQRTLLLLPAHGRVAAGLVAVVQQGGAVTRVILSLTRQPHVWGAELAGSGGPTLGQSQNSAALLVDFLQQALRKTADVVTQHSSDLCRRGERKNRCQPAARVIADRRCSSYCRLRCRCWQWGLFLGSGDIPRTAHPAFRSAPVPLAAWHLILNSRLKG